MSLMEITQGMIWSVVTSFFTIVGTVIAFTRRVSRFNADVENLRKSFDNHVTEGWSYKKHAEELEAKVKANDVRFAQIETDLQWIKTTLVKIDQKIQ